MEWLEIYERLNRLRPGWHVNSRGHLERCFRFPDFVQALAFANKITPIAEAAGHHPELHIAWGECTVETWSHDVDGLTERDFALAADVDRILNPTAASPTGV